MTSATGDRILEQIQESRKAVEEFVSVLDEGALTTPGAEGWSIKDHVAHLTAWRKMVLGYLEGRPGHEGLGVSEETRAGGEDAINAVLFEKHRDRSWAD